MMRQGALPLHQGHIRFQYEISELVHAVQSHMSTMTTAYCLLTV